MHASCFGISFDEISLTFVQHIHYMTSANDNSTLKHIPMKQMEILKAPNTCHCLYSFSQSIWWGFIRLALS
jgi:hypothetical protein